MRIVQRAVLGAEEYGSERSGDAVAEVSQLLGGAMYEAKLEVRTWLNVQAL